MHYCVAIEERGGIKIAPHRRGGKSQRSALALLEQALVSLGFRLVYYISDETATEKAYKKGNITVVVNYVTTVVASSVSCSELQEMVNEVEKARKKHVADYYL